ncbi:hypothetical protein ACFSGX_08595 [Sphingomonas arantia]|uniref:DUF3077 domain-containing protein n=1 Tax=Sphingomonas arantia TaxID=1460676 RepID=A0ABW4TZJ5_9SPHN
MPTNDNDVVQRNRPSSGDGHGQAALLLIECLIHGLCEKAALNNAEAISIVYTAVDAQLDRLALAEDQHCRDDQTAPLWQSYGLLVAIAESLKTNGGGLPSVRPV